MCFLRIFSNQFRWNSVCCHNLFVCWAHAKFIVNNIQGRELCWPDFIKYTLSCVATLVNKFVSNFVWCCTWLNSTVWFPFGWPSCSLKAVLNWARTHVYEQLCLLEIFKHAIDLNLNWWFRSWRAAAFKAHEYELGCSSKMFPAQDMGVSFWLVELFCGQRRRNKKGG